MGRMDQNSETRYFNPQVTLQSCTKYLMGTIFAAWWGSRFKEPITAATVDELLKCPDTPYEMNEYLREEGLVEVALMICDGYPEYAGAGNGMGTDFKNVIRKVCQLVADSDFPVLESIKFAFELDNVTVAYREQLVRERKAGYWTQSSRTMDMSTMDVNRSPVIDIIGGQEAVDIYDAAVETLRDAYRKLQAMGIPSEEIRLIPQANVHRVEWFVDARILLKLFAKRADWIAQATLWAPIMAGVLAAFEEEDPEFAKFLRQYVGNPNVKVDYDKQRQIYVIKSHHYEIDNYDRWSGKDPLPVDPLWLAFSGHKQPQHTNVKYYRYLKSIYIQLWGDEYLKVLGWDRQHPGKIGFYDV